LLENRNLTSYPSLQTDLKNAGVNWHDKEVVVDNGLVINRSPEDLDAFNKKWSRRLLRVCIRLHQVINWKEPRE